MLQNATLVIFRKQMCKKFTNHFFYWKTHVSVAVTVIFVCKDRQEIQGNLAFV